LPYLPQVIGIVTSPTGAVIRDILHRLADRFPCQVIVWPVRVQGETAAEEVTAAIAGFNAMTQKPDLLIVARGGGSLEDLWPFNDEAIVRAVVASSIPVISAIGHETDTTLIDHAADRRAPTPTAAAEMAVPVRRDLLACLANLDARQARAVTRLAQEYRLKLSGLARALPRPDELLAYARQRLDLSAQKLPSGLGTNLQRHALALATARGKLSLRPIRDRAADWKRRLAQAGERARRSAALVVSRKADRFTSESKLLQTLSYRAILARGFIIVRDARGLTLRQAAAVKPGSGLVLEFADGKLEATATPAKAQGSLF
jgi:exodeoxyribonuclease VII large subunit